MKFECKGYGDCCRNLKQKTSRERLEKFASTNVLNLAVSPEDIGLPLFDWEVDAVRKAAGYRYVSIRPLWIAVNHRNIPVVVMWHLSHADCPFLGGDRCTIYNERPEICRSFPVTSSGFIQLMKGEPNVRLASSSACRCWSGNVPDMGSMAVDEMHRKFHEIFGPSYLAALRYDMKFIFVSSLLQRLADAGKIKAVYMDVKQTEKILAKGHIGFVDFLERERIMTRENIGIQLGDIEKRARNLVGLS